MSSSSEGGTGGEKKLKKESVGFALRTKRVRFVSDQLDYQHATRVGWWKQPTFIPLLFDLELLGQVFVLLPLDIGTVRTVIDKVASVSHLFLIEIRLVQNPILKVVIGTKMEADLETGFRFVTGEVRETDINEVFESTRVAFRDEV